MELSYLMHLLSRKILLNKMFSEREGIKLCNLKLMCDDWGGDSGKVCDCIYSTICVNEKMEVFNILYVCPSNSPHLSFSLPGFYQDNQLLGLNNMTKNI